MIEYVIAGDKRLPAILQQTPVIGGNSVLLTPAQRSGDRGDCVSEVLKENAKCSSQKEEKKVFPLQSFCDEIQLCSTLFTSVNDTEQTVEMLSRH